MQENKEKNMSKEDELMDYQREWREGITKKLDHLNDKIDNFPNIFANAAQFNYLKNEVDTLKSFKNKAIGIIVGVQTVLTILGYLLIHFK